MNRESDGAEHTARTSHPLHDEYEPEDPIHKAVNITYRLLKDRIEPVKHDEWDIWRARDDETGRELESYWDTPEEAVDMLAKKVKLEMCHVNECINHLGQDSDRMYCDDHTESEYIECAAGGCDYPRSHPKTDHCSHHTWNLGRKAEPEGSA